MAWSDSDRDKAIWFFIRQRQTCSMCGTRPDEWDSSKGGHPMAYVATVHRCHGCEQIAKLNDRIKDESMRPVLKRNEEVKRAHS
ncbi:hypothetical protein [Microbispora bryophytorum]|uniref:hypothetical protein n=1 Tax=Microbispora bryophytorum TaxID=1460882 RepID=UPI0033CA77F1